MSISTLQADPAPRQWREMLDLMADAQRDGLDMKGQVAARPVGLIISLEGRANPLQASPAYREVADLPVDERAAALQEPERRRSVIEDCEGALAGRGARMFVLDEAIDYDPGFDNSLQAISERTGKSIAELVVDQLTSRNGDGQLYTPVMNYSDGNFDAIREMLDDPNTVPGLGDAGAHCTLICDGSFPTYLMTHWGRDVAEDRRFDVEWIVKSQCADTAALVGLHDRGVLADGYKADVNVIDFERLAITPPEMLYDLPAGGKRLVQRARGYEATIVSGEITFRHGEPTGALPGALVRGAQPAPA